MTKVGCRQQKRQLGGEAGDTLGFALTYASVLVDGKLAIERGG